MEDREHVDQHALTTAFTDLRSRLARLIRRIVGKESVDDLLQETFLKTYEAASRQAIHHPHSFMLATAKNLALNYIALADNKLTDSVGGLDEIDACTQRETVAAEVDFESRERLMAFCRAVERLPLECRRIFVMKRVDGLSQRDIAARLGISENTVEKQVGKGLVMCADFMSTMGHPIGAESTQQAPGRRRSPRR